MTMQSAPNWQVSTLDGSPTPTIADFTGRPTMIFFFNLGCHGCMTRGIPLANEIVKQYPEVAVVGIHTNFEGLPHEKPAVLDALQAHDIQFPVFYDDGHATYTAYEAGGTPHWILLDEEGNIERSIFGSQPNAVQRLSYALIERFPDS
ncbi:MAG: TlpA disulfide reductase family protein [Chloroflexota bacterium]